MGAGSRDLAELCGSGLCSFPFLAILLSARDAGEMAGDPAAILTPDDLVAAS